LHDSPPKLTTEEDNDLSKLLPSQKKKMRQKQRKAEARAKKVIILVFSSVGKFLLEKYSCYCFPPFLGGRRKK